MSHTDDEEFDYPLRADIQAAATLMVEPVERALSDEHDARVFAEGRAAGLAEALRVQPGKPERHLRSVR